MAIIVSLKDPGRRLIFSHRFSVLLVIVISRVAVIFVMGVLLCVRTYASVEYSVYRVLLVLMMLQ